MSRLPSPLALLAALLLAGCGAPSRLPDGGAPRQVCTAEHVYVPVRVLDGAGKPVEGAVVTGRNQARGVSSTGTTNADGLTTAIGEDLGPGTVTVSAVAGTRVTDTKQLSFTCGECHCSGQPGNLTLTLQ